MRPRLLLVAPRQSYRIAAYLRAAEQLGVDVLVASDGPHSLISAVADGLHIDPAEPEQALSRLLREVAERPIQGVVGCDDSTVELASRFAAALGLAGNPPESALLSRRKDLARDCLARAGVAKPEHRVVAIADLEDGRLPDLPFPLVSNQ